MAMERRVALIVLLLSAVVLSPMLAFAQGAQTTSDWGALKNLPNESKLEVKLKSGKTVDGKLGSVSDESLSVISKSGNVEIKREEVATIHQIVKKSATSATLIGMGVGAGAGAALGAIAASNDDNSLDKIDHAATAGLAVVGAGVGAITGYLIGKRATKRVLLYESK